jgi:hypothetical protein
MSWMKEHPDATDHFMEQAHPAVISLTMHKTPAIQEMNRREEACVAAIDSMLRTGRFNSPAACSNVEVSLADGPYAISATDTH